MKNQGVGAALITGIEYARRLNPEIVVILDADGQHNPTDIPRLIKPIVDGKAELVLGSRFLDESSSSMETLKKKGNKVLTSIVNMMVGKKLTDTQTGFRAFSRRALLTLDLKSKFTYTQEMVLSLCLRGYRCIEIPIHVSSRKYGKSKVVSNIISYAFKALVIIFSTYLLMWSRR